MSLPDWYKHDEPYPGLYTYDKREAGILRGIENAETQDVLDYANQQLKALHALGRHGYDRMLDRVRNRIKNNTPWPF